MSFAEHGPTRPKVDDMDLVASHQRLLVGAAMRTKGPILELGVGWYSTPLLHEIAEVQGRQLLTVDNNDHWLRQFKPLQTKHHALHLVGWWGELYRALEGLGVGHIGLVFCDQGQPIEREYATRRLIEVADVFVFHDTEEGFAYGYDRLLGDRRYIGSTERTHDGYFEFKPTGRVWGHPDGMLTTGMFKHQYTDKAQKVWTTCASNAIDVSQWFLDLPPVEPAEEVT